MIHETHIPKFDGFKRAGIRYVADNCYGPNTWKSTTKGPKIVDGRVVCNEKRFYRFKATREQAIANGFKPVFQ